MDCFKLAPRVGVLLNNGKTGDARPGVLCPNLWVTSLCIPLAAGLDSFSDVLFIVASYSVVWGVAIVGHKLFDKKGRTESTLSACCGAVCSECSFFLDNMCPSCPEGDFDTQKACEIFTCARRKGTTCHACDKRMRCDIFRDERENCPFEKELPLLHTGLGYVVYEKNPQKSIELFKDYVCRGEFGLMVSRKFPDQTQARFDLQNVAHVWLSTAEGSDNWIDPCNLSKLHHMITDFIRNAPISVVLFEGFEYLMVRNSFLTALKFVQSLMDEVVLNRSRMILSINSHAYSGKELALIRRELIELDLI